MHAEKHTTSTIEGILDGDTTEQLLKEPNLTLDTATL